MPDRGGESGRLGDWHSGIGVLPYRTRGGGEHCCPAAAIRQVCARGWQKDQGGPVAWDSCPGILPKITHLGKLSQITKLCLQEFVLFLFSIELLLVLESFPKLSSLLLRLSLRPGARYYNS